VLNIIIIFSPFLIFTFYKVVWLHRYNVVAKMANVYCKFLAGSNDERILKIE